MLNQISNKYITLKKTISYLVSTYTTSFYPKNSKVVTRYKAQISIQEIPFIPSEAVVCKLSSYTDTIFILQCSIKYLNGIYHVLKTNLTQDHTEKHHNIIHKKNLK